MVDPAVVVGAVVDVVVATVVVASVVVVVATVVVVVGCVVVVVPTVVVVVGCVVVVPTVVVIVGCGIVDAVVVDAVVVGAVGPVVDVVPDSIVVPLAAVLDPVTVAVPAALLDAETVVGPGGRTATAATDCREVGFGLEVRWIAARAVVLGFSVPPASDNGTVVSSRGAVTESSVANETGGAIVDDVVVVDASSNCRADGGPESVQPAIMTTAAATSRTPTRRARSIAESIPRSGAPLTSSAPFRLPPQIAMDELPDVIRLSEDAKAVRAKVEKRSPLR